MANTTYANSSSNTQSTIYDILSSDTTVFTVRAKASGDPNATLTTSLSEGMKVIDGEPTYNQLKNYAFPKVLVHTPTMNEERLTMTKFLITANCRIEVMCTNERDLRNVYDAVRNALKTNQNTTKAATMFWYLSPTSSISNFVGQNEKVIYTLTMNVRYMVSG